MTDKELFQEIEKFLAENDLRFGQLMSAIRHMIALNGGDMFYSSNDEIFEVLKEFN